MENLIRKYKGMLLRRVVITPRPRVTPKVFSSLKALGAVGAHGLRKEFRAVGYAPQTLEYQTGKMAREAVQLIRHTLKLTPILKLEATHPSYPTLAPYRSTSVYEKDITLNFWKNFIFSARRYFGEAKRNQRREWARISECNVPRALCCRDRYFGSDGELAYRIPTGRVFTDPGTILRLAELRRARIVYTSKRPWDARRFVGIELELVSKVRREVLGPRLMPWAKYVCLKSDGSLRPHGAYEYTHELCILAPMDNFESVIRGICAELAKDCAVNKTCGMHTHLDMGYRPNADYGLDNSLRTASLGRAKKVFRNLARSLQFLVPMIPASRRNNQYCRKNYCADYDRMQRGGGRYWMVNPQSFRRYGTIEVRMHGGTIDPAKIINWVSLLWAIADADMAGIQRVRKLNWLAAVCLPRHLVEYMASRTALFADAPEAVPGTDDDAGGETPEGESDEDYVLEESEVA